MKKRIIALLLCICLVGSMTVYAVGDEIKPTIPESDALTEPVIEEIVTLLDASEPELTYFETMMAAESADEMLSLLLADQVAAAALSVEEIANLTAKAEALPEDDSKEELLETLAVIGGESDLNGAETLAPSGTPLTSAGGKLATGSYYLSNNLQLNENIIIPKGATVTIDLNGMVLSSNKGGTVINVEGNATLNIIDSNPNEGHHGNITAEGLWVQQDGNYTSQSKGGFITSKGNGRAITVSGILNMTGGTIAGCKATHAAAISGTSDGQITIDGTRIIYNITEATAGASSAAIHNEPDYGGIPSFLKMTNAVISHNKGNENGGAIFGYDVTLTNCKITNNEAKYGAGIYLKTSGSHYGSMTITGCEISNNKATYGGGIYGDAHSTININGKSSIKDNEAYHTGGGIFGYNVNIKGTSDQKIIVSGNKAHNDGGGIAGMGTDNDNLGNVVIKHCEITRNRAGVAGGGIYTNMYCKLDVDDTNITYNDAIDFNLTEASYSTKVGRGGGAYVQNYSTFDNVHIDYNRAMRYGGGLQVCNANGDAYLNSGSISHNVAICDGAGGVHVTESCVFSMKGGEIIGNECYEVGGAIHASYEATVKIEDGVIKDNIVHSGRGGAIHVDVGVNLQIIGDTLITKNKALTGYRANMVSIESTNPGAKVTVARDGNCMEGYGGAICVDSGIFEMTAGAITDNYAEVGGGGVALVMIIMSENEPNRNKVVNFNMEGGAITNNKTDGNGGGLYMMKNNIGSIIDEKLQESDLSQELIAELNALKEGVPQLNITDGCISNNEAVNLGGGAYLEENTEFIIGGTGEVNNNTAVDGAGIYIAQGTAKINGGTMSSNEASNHGGALYINGTVTMTDGAITQNSAVRNGGALYVTGGDFTMISGSITGNKATGSDGSTGGGVYVEGGNITIGVEKCTGEGDTHTEEPKDKSHPVVSNNIANDCGGGLAVMGNGTITMHCGDISGNTAPNKGRGENVYMQGGAFTYNGGNVGETTDPDLVIVGGTLDNNVGGDKASITVTYVHCNDQVTFEAEHKDKLQDKNAIVSTGSYFNLPDGEKYWTAPAGYNFFGWTEEDSNKGYVRDKNQYKGLGVPYVKSENTTLYALWAPTTNQISYTGSLIDGSFVSETITSTPTTYTYSVTAQYITIQSPQKAGYDFVGWYVYQDEGQNANWGDKYEPVYTDESNKIPANLNFTAMKEDQFVKAGSNGTTNLYIDGTNFGNITLVAEFKSAYTSLTITKTGWDAAKDANQAFMFKIIGDPYDPNLANVELIVTIQGNDSVTINNLPVGDYTVTELNDWSWRYADQAAQKIELTDSSKTDYGVTFNNVRNNDLWLSGEDFEQNLFGRKTPVGPTN